MLILAPAAFEAPAFLVRLRMLIFFAKPSCLSLTSASLEPLPTRIAVLEALIQAPSQAGLPGVGLGQDPIEYFTDTWHTNLDTYERIIEDDVKKDAIVVAAMVYQLSMRDDMPPRFTAADMPPKPSPEGGAQPAAAQAAGSSAQPEPVRRSTQPENTSQSPKNKEN